MQDTNSTKKARATETPKIIAGFSQIGAESAWRTCNTESVKKAAEDAGIQLVYFNAEQKQENQIKAIRSFIAYQVNVIIFVPIVEDGWDNVLKEAKNAGIPVIITDRKIKTLDDSLYAGYIGTDSVEEGRKAARYLLQNYKGRSGHFSICEIKGTDGSSAAEGRYNGFREVISKDSRFEIIYSVSGDFLRSCGNEIMDKILKENNGLNINGTPIDIIFSHNDGMTLGVLDVLKTTNIRPGKDVKIITIDAEQASIDALKNGEVNCVVECNPKIGPQIMKFVEDLANNIAIPKLTHVNEQVFTDHEDLSSIEERGY